MIKPSTNLLNLLLAGCNVQLPNGVKLVGEDKSILIRLIHNKNEYGTQPKPMNIQGLRDALDDADKIYANALGDDFADLTNPNGGRYHYISGIGIFTRLACHTMGYLDIPPRKSLKNYNILNEDGLWLDGADTRVEIRRKFVARLEKV
jgi:hypothetical protein